MEEFEGLLLEGIKETKESSIWVKGKKQYLHIFQAIAVFGSFSL